MCEAIFIITKYGGNYVTLPDGRILEYFIYGEKKNYQKTIIEFNSFSGAKVLASTTNEDYQRLKIRGIGITIPGFGFSSLKINRKLNEWHRDVEVVLKKENVKKFWLKGISFGCMHWNIRHDFSWVNLPHTIVENIFPNFQKPPSFIFSSVIGKTLWYVFAGTNFISFDYEQLHLMDKYPETIQYVQDMDRNVNHLGWMDNLKMISEPWGFEFDKIEVSKLWLIYAEDDPISDPKFTEFFFERNPNAKIIKTNY
eukprot:gene4475-7856_t